MKFRNVSIFKPKRRNKKHHPWLIAYGIGDDRKTMTASTDLAATRELAERLSIITQNSKIGLGDPVDARIDIERRRSITDHLNEFEAHLVASGNTSKHASQMRLYAEESLDDFRLIDEVVSSKVQIKINGLKCGTPAKNRRAYATKKFIEWGASDSRWPKSLLDRINLARLPQSRTYRRRVLPLGELARLLATTEHNGSSCGLNSRERALLYRTMLASGLRLGEAGKLVSNFLTDSGLDLPAAVTKNRKEAFISLSADLIQQLNEQATGKGPTDRLFPFHQFNPDRMLKADLKAAGIDRLTKAGVFDFHSFRHQCATVLASAGAPAKAIQSHMRHGSIKLTLDTYGHLMDRDRSKTTEVLGHLVQRRAQQGKESTMANLSCKQWSDGESNPDLLNAIQHADALITLEVNELRDKHKRRIAPRTAQRLLRKLASGAITKFNDSRRRAGGR